MCWVNRTMKGIQWAVYSVSRSLCGLVLKVTFSRSCLSCLVLASREHMVCWGATTVHTHLPSLSWAELYTCHDSSGLAGSTWAKDKTKSKKGQWLMGMCFMGNSFETVLFFLSMQSLGRLITWILNKSQSDRVSGHLSCQCKLYVYSNNHTFMYSFLMSRELKRLVAYGLWNVAFVNSAEVNVSLR